eukprot:m.82374 g.82374  ORF g.82374 m.82374 type:complete len:984 (-) comp13404_c0_seq5:18-2969(-)
MSWQATNGRAQALPGATAVSPEAEELSDPIEEEYQEDFEENGTEQESNGLPSDQEDHLQDGEVVPEEEEEVSARPVSKRPTTTSAAAAAAVPVVVTAPSPAKAAAASIPEAYTPPPRHQPVSRLRFETPLQAPTPGALNGLFADTRLPPTSAANGTASRPTLGASAAERLAKAYSPGVRNSKRTSPRTPTDNLIQPIPRITVSENTPTSAYSPSLGTPRRAWDQPSNGRSPIGQSTRAPLTEDDSFEKLCDTLERSLRDHLRIVERAAEPPPQMDEPEEPSGPPLSSAMRSVSSLSPVMVQAVVGERNRLRAQVQRLTRDLERAQQASGGETIAAAALASDLRLLRRIQASVTNTLVTRDTEIARLAQQAAQAGQHVAAAEARTAALANEAARMDARLAQHLDKARQDESVRATAAEESAQRLEEALVAQEQRLAAQAKKDIKDAIAATEARMREHAQRTLTEQLAAQEKKLEAVHAERLRQVALEHRNAAIEEKARVLRAKGEAAESREARLLEKQRDELAAEHAQAIQALQTKLTQAEEKFKKELAAQQANAEATLRKRLDEQQRTHDVELRAVTDTRNTEALQAKVALAEEKHKKEIAALQANADLVLRKRLEEQQRAHEAELRVAADVRNTEGQRSVRAAEKSDWEAEKNRLTKQLAEEHRAQLEQALAAQKQSLEAAADKARAAALEQQKQQHARELARLKGASATQKSALEKQLAKRSLPQPPEPSSSRAAPSTQTLAEARSVAAGDVKAQLEKKHAREMADLRNRLEEVQRELKLARSSNTPSAAGAATMPKRTIAQLPVARARTLLADARSSGGLLAPCQRAVTSVQQGIAGLLRDTKGDAIDLTPANGQTLLDLLAETTTALTAASREAQEQARQLQDDFERQAREKAPARVDTRELQASQREVAALRQSLRAANDALERARATSSAPTPSRSAAPSPMRGGPSAIAARLQEEHRIMELERIRLEKIISNFGSS